MATVLVSVAWFIPPENDLDMPQYRMCDLCCLTATDDVLAGKMVDDFRQFFQEVTDGVPTLNICEHCLEEYL